MQAKMESLKAALERAELNLQYGTIRAPIGGRIGDSLIPVGGLVTPNSPQPLTTIVPLDPIWIRFKVTESEYLGWVARAQKSQVRLILADGREFPQKGRIENTLNQVDPKTGTLEVQASFPNPGRGLLPGQFGRVRVQVEERKNAFAVPQRAVQQLQNLQTVYTVGEDNKVQARPVRPGARVGELWVIEEGLRPGDRVIVEGHLRVRPGAVVKAMPYRPAGGGKGD
jgi:membrane fusion protein (multidrug efflux system)